MDEEHIKFTSTDSQDATFFLTEKHNAQNDAYKPIALLDVEKVYSYITYNHRLFILLI